MGKRKKSQKPKPQVAKPPAKTKPQPSNQKQGKRSKLLQSFANKLESGRFRYLNEQLYTTTSDEAFELFQKNQKLFTVYHKGFTSQVQNWPENPVNVIIKQLRKQPQWEIADFGCGDAKIARALHKQSTIHSFDLVKPNEFVTVCNSANVPLKDEQVDAAVFCLSLMGVDYQRFLIEANRVMKLGGTLFVAEVKSRFTGSSSAVGEFGDEDAGNTNAAMKKGIKQFVSDLVPLGFDLINKDASNQMFVLFKFKKSDRKIAAAHRKTMTNTLGSCKYKKR